MGEDIDVSKLILFRNKMGQTNSGNSPPNVNVGDKLYYIQLKTSDGGINLWPSQWNPFVRDYKIVVQEFRVIAGACPEKYRVIAYTMGASGYLDPSTLEDLTPDFT